MNPETPFLIVVGVIVFLLGAIAGGLIDRFFATRTVRRKTLPKYEGTRLRAYLEQLNRGTR